MIISQVFFQFSILRNANSSAISLKMSRNLFWNGKLSHLFSIGGSHALWWLPPSWKKLLLLQMLRLLFTKEQVCHELVRTRKLYQIPFVVNDHFTNPTYLDLPKNRSLFTDVTCFRLEGVAHCGNFLHLKKLYFMKKHGFHSPPLKMGSTERKPLNIE